MMANTSGSGFSLHNLRCRADKLMMGLLWGLFAYSLALANWYDTWSEAFLIGLPSALIPSIIIFLMAGSFISRAAVGSAFMIFAALTIHQAHGMVEMHFLIFVLLAFMLAYRDWMVVVLSAAIIAVHHLAFSFLQASGEGVYIFGGEASVMLVVIHAAFVVFETAILVHFSIQGKREALQTEEIHTIGSHLQVTDGVVDLVYRVPDAKSTFAHQFNDFMAHLHDTVKSLSSANTELLQATAIMTQVANDTSVSARQQESDISQVATAINEMTATVQEVANTTTMAADAADSASAETSNGRSVVTETVASIHGLADEIERISDVVNRVNNNSDEIGSVLDVIREIAEQTNLLALNAAIEAARAGEQGRGFAVVADEVRVLASRTQASTQEIQATISRLQEGTTDAVQTMEQGRERVQRSVEQASATGASLETIADSVTTINDMNRQIASAAEEQSSVAEEINKSVVKINQVAEKTVATGVKLTDATGQLDALASVLKKEANKFRI